MIAKVSSHSTPIRPLIDYLFGPGRANEHTDQHVVAGSRLDAPVVMQPGQVAGRFDTADLVAKLDQWNTAYGADAQVWHCSVSIPAVDGLLTDGQWREVAQRLVDEVGLGDCEWVAVRHGVSANGNDHIHIAARKIDGFGQKIATGFDARTVRGVCREFEDRWDLTKTREVDGTAAKAATRPEIERAARAGRDIPTRDRLQVIVRAAAGAAPTFDTFLDSLRRSGLQVNLTRPDDHGQPRGITFADPGYVDGKNKPVAFGGGQLAKDLSLGSLKARFDARAAQTEALPAAEQAIGQIVDAAEKIAAGAPGAMRGLWEAADMLGAAAQVIEANPNGPLHQAAAQAAAAARPGYVSVPPAPDWAASIRVGMLALWAGAARDDAAARQRRELMMVMAAYRLMRAGTAHLTAAGNLRRAEAARRSVTLLAQQRDQLQAAVDKTRAQQYGPPATVAVSRTYTEDTINTTYNDPTQHRGRSM